LFSDCLQFDLETKLWSNHSILLTERDESAIGMLGSQLYMIGGLTTDSVEVLDVTFENSWFEGPVLPFPLARSCAVSTNASILVMGGHSNQSYISLPSLLELSQGEDGIVRWTQLADMNQPRRDHGCLFVEFESSKGVLVTGGLGSNGEVLNTSEFYDMKTKVWKPVRPMQTPRAEHVMSLVFGIPTVIGGINGKQFISSIEQFDKTQEDPFRRSWRIVNQMLSAPRYELASASVPASKISACLDDINNP